MMTAEAGLPPTCVTDGVADPVEKPSDGIDSGRFGVVATIETAALSLVEAIKHLRTVASTVDGPLRDVHMLAADVIYGVFRALERGDVDAVREPFDWAREDLKKHKNGTWFGASPDDRVRAQIQLLHDVEAILARYRPVLVASTNSARARQRRQKHERPGPDMPTVAVVGGARVAVESEVTFPDDLEHAPPATLAAVELVFMCFSNAVVRPIVPPLPKDAVTKVADVLVRNADQGQLEVLAITRAILRALGATKPKPADLFKAAPVEAWLAQLRLRQVARHG
jgi:hypothetical protein